ncbi:MAG TPA: MFS transporter [Polyangiaceae bacterium]|jgi:OPA family glycerol-3-phosphate transporter-like MFS transporter|nr:MFS transporter [Polyangiaceae bacterium]
MYASLPGWIRELLPIVVLLTVITLVVGRLPRVEVGHTTQFRHRRFWNWFPAGMTYAFLYFARYNLTAYKNAVGMSHDAYGTIDLWGAVVYGVAFIVNGPLTDRVGGRITLLLAAVGAAGANLGMAAMAFGGWAPEKTGTFVLLYVVNMYFQSFGAVSIVKVNASWFHLRERGTFGGIFGILISLGVYFAYDWGPRIAKLFPHPAYVFVVPPVALLVAAVADFFLVRDTPGQAGHADFDTADASSGDTGDKVSLLDVAKRMLTNKTILTIAAIEFCSGFLRNAIMKWYQPYAKGIGISSTIVPSNWGMLLCCAGILGGVFGGTISDHLFGSRRGPVSSILYGGMVVGAGVMYLTLGTMALGWTVVFMSLCVIGVHGMLSGTASMDFGGKKNVGVAVGIIDGFVYLGTALQDGLLKGILPDGDAQKVAANWRYWPLVMAPFALLGLLLATRVWNAKPKPGGAH